MFAERLKKLRLKNDLTQSDLAEKLNVAKSTIAGYEKGFRKPQIKALNEMARIFNTSTDYLLGISDDPMPAEPSKDLAELLRIPDYTYKGTKLEDKDLDLIIHYLENITQSKNNHTSNKNNANDLKEDLQCTHEI